MSPLFCRLAHRYIVPSTTKNAGLRRVFDIEADDLLDTATKLNCIVIADLDSNQIYEYGPEQITDALAHLARANYLTGHNIQAYDLPLLQRLYGWTPAADTEVVDTLVAGRLILPNVGDIDDQVAAMGGGALKKLRGRYSIEAWGVRLGVAKVGTDIKDFSVWTPELQARCVGDVKITKALWRFLESDGYSAQAMELEHRVNSICNQIEADGAPFDDAAAERLEQRWTVDCNKMEATLREQFPGMNPNSRPQIAKQLEARGWIPEERTEKTGQPRITDELLETLPQLYPEFASLSDYYILKRRIAQLSKGKKAWRKHVGKDGRLHGGIVHIGTPHSRASHSGPNLAQVPNPKRGTPYANECRALFQAPDGWVFVPADQATLQDRTFAHYLTKFDRGAYAEAFLRGDDQHWKGAITLDLMPTETVRDKQNKVHEIIREGAKSFRYAFLFGAQNERAGHIIYKIIRSVQHVDSASDQYRKFFGSAARPSKDALQRVGRRARDKFEAGTPGLRALRQALRSHAERHGWLFGLDGRRVPVRALYSALNFIVTSAEAIICKRWLVQVYDELCARFHYGWDSDVVISLWIHDEIACCCRAEIAAEVGEIMVRHAKAAGEFYGLRVPLDADFKIGRNWANEPLEDQTAANAAAKASHKADEAAITVESPSKDANEAPIEIAPTPTAEPMQRCAQCGSAETAENLNCYDGILLHACCEDAFIRQRMTEEGLWTEAPTPHPKDEGAVAAQTTSSSSTPPPTSSPSPSSRSGNGSSGNGFGGFERTEQVTQTGGEDPYPHGEDRKGHRIATYLYRDYLGGNHTEVTKWRAPKTKRAQYPQRFWVNGRWVSEKPVGWLKVPYRLPELLKAITKDPNITVYNPEGEKDVKTLVALGLVATTNSEGATPLKAKTGKWTPELNKWFHGVRHLVIPADNDEVGRKFAEEKARALESIVPDIRIVYFPDTDKGEDITWWLDHGHTKEELLARCAAAPRWQNRAVLESVRASDVSMRAIIWLWDKRFAIGKIGIIAGLPDEGKGQILCYIAARVTQSLEWPNNEGRAPQGNVVILSAEEDPGDSLAPRLAAAGADLDRIYFIKMVVDRDEKTGQQHKRMFSFVSDLEKLRQKIIEIGDVIVVLIDPISAYLGVGKIDSYRDTDVRAVLGPLKELAEEMRVAVITVMHFNKKVDITNALLRVSNSMAFVGLPRHAYSVVADNENHRKLFVRAKNNDAAEADNKTLAFHFDAREVGKDPDTNAEIHAPFIVWEPEYVDVTATEAMQAASESKSPSERNRAKNLVRAFLLAGDGRALKTEIEEYAKAEQISAATLRRVKDDLEIYAEKDNSTPKGPWFWVLPEDQ